MFCDRIELGSDVRNELDSIHRIAVKKVDEERVFTSYAATTRAADVIAMPTGNFEIPHSKR
jgi:hypothetical protein